MIKKITAVFLLTLSFAFAGCSSASKKNSVLDSHWQKKQKTISFKKFTAPMKWAAGQFVVTGLIKDDEKVSVTKITIVGKENDGWIIETITTNEDGEISGMQFLMKGYDQAVKKNDLSLITAQWAKILQADGKVQKIEGESMMVYNMILKSTWEKMILSGSSSATGAAILVPAGSFSGTTVVKATVKVLFSTYTQISYLHPDVPVNGLVKAETEGENSYTELLDYGFDGKPFIK